MTGDRQEFFFDDMLNQEVNVVYNNRQDVMWDM